MNNKKRLRTPQALFIAWRHTVAHPVSTFICVAVVAIALVYVNVLGYHGFSIYNYQKTITSDDINRVVAIARNPNDRKSLFDSRRIQSIRYDLPADAVVYKQIMLGVFLSVGDGEETKVTAESLVPGSPGITTCLVHGRDISSENANEIIVSESLLERLWGRLEKGSVPSHVKLNASRYTKDGRQENETINLRLAGVKRNMLQKNEAFIPQGVIETLEKWWSNDIAAISKGGAGAEAVEMKYGSARAFIEGGVSDGEIQNDAAQRKIEMKKVSSFDESSSKGDPIVLVSRKDGKHITDEDAARIAAGMQDARLECWMFGLSRHHEADMIVMASTNKARVKAFDLDDKRHQGQKDSGLPADLFKAVTRLGDVMVSERFAARLRFDGHSPMRLETSGTGLRPSMNITGTVRPNAKLGEFDVLCSIDTLAYMQSRVRTGKACMVWTSDPALARMFDKQFGRNRDAYVQREEICMAFYEGDNYYNYSFYAKEKSPAFSFKALEMGGGAVSARFIPDDIIKSVTVPQKDGKLVPAVVTASAETVDCWYNSQRFKDWAKAKGIAVSGIFCGQGNELWLPQSSMKSFCDRPDSTGVMKFCYGDARSIGAMGAKAFACKSYSIIFEGGKDAVKNNVGKLLKPANLEPVTLEFVEMEVLPKTDVAYAGPVDMSLFICADDSISRLPHDWARNYPSMKSGDVLVSYSEFNQAGPMSMSVGGIEVKAYAIKTGFPEGRPRAMLLPESFVSSNMAIFIDISQSFEDAKPQQAELLLQDSRSSGLAAEALMSFSVKPAFSDEKRKIVCYSVRDLSSKDGFMDRNIIPALRSDRKFIDVCPDIEISGSVAGQANSQFRMLGSHPGDPTKFMYKSAHGWLTSDSDNSSQIILPMDALKGMSADPKRLINSTVKLVFVKDQRRSYAEPELTWEFVVKEVVPGDTGFVPIKLAEKIRLWAAGAMLFDNASLSFKSPSRETGHTRCNIYLKSLDEVRPVVDKLRSCGYDTEDSIASQENLRKAQRAILTLVTLMVFGTILDSILNVGLTTWLNTSTRIYVMGILRACGASRLDVFKQFLYQGVMVGILAFALSVPMSCGAEPLIRPLIEKHVLGKLGDILAAPIYDPSFFWLFGLSFVIGLAFSVFGVMFSAIMTSTRRIITLITRRE